MPMLLMIATAALQSGLTVALVKLLTELGESGDFLSHLLLAFCLIAAAIASGTYQVWMLNKAMKFYDQMEAMPIF